MEFQSPAPPPTPPLLWLQRHPPPPPGCNNNLEMTSVNLEIQRDADIWRRKKSSSSSAESSADISKTKKEALSPAKGKKVWRCSICQVRTTSEAELENHFQGKKHRSMEAVSKPKGNGSRTVGLGVPHEPRVESRSEPLLQTLSPIISRKCSEENYMPMLPKRKGKEDFAFWCEMCNVGADHENVWKSHLNEKHLSQHQKQSANVDGASFVMLMLMFDKAVQDPEHSPIYAEMFSDLIHILLPLPSDEPGGEVITVKRFLLNMCQEAYEGAVKLRPNTEGGDTNNILKRRIVGIVCLLGELFNRRMLTDRIAHEIVKELLGNHTDICPVENNVEVACHLLSRIGHRFDKNPNSRRLNDQYFNCLEDIALNYRFSFELRAMIHDLLDLRRSNWIAVPEEEVEAETVVENTLFGTVDTNNGEVSQPLFSESPTLNQRRFVQGNGVAPISGRTGGVRSLHFHTTCRCWKDSIPVDELVIAAFCIFCLVIVLSLCYFLRFILYYVIL